MRKVCRWERLVTFYQFPREYWPHLRTSNVVESPFATVLILKILQVIQSTLRTDRPRSESTL